MITKALEHLPDRLDHLEENRANLSKLGYRAVDFLIRRLIFDLHVDVLTRGDILPEGSRVRNHGDRLFRVKIIGRA